MDQLPITRPVVPIGDQQPDARQFARRLARRRANLGVDDHDDGDDFAPTDSGTRPATVDPTQPLLEALDRLRVTQDLRPADHEYAVAVAKLRAYQDPTTAYYAR